MNQKILLTCAVSILMSGCSSVLYSDRQAPVVNMNTTIPSGYQGAQTTQIPNAAPRSVVHPVPVQSVGVGYNNIPTQPVQVAQPIRSDVIASTPAPYDNAYPQPIQPAAPTAVPDQSVNGDGWSIRPESPSINPGAVSHTNAAGAVRPDESTVTRPLQPTTQTTVAIPPAPSTPASPSSDEIPPAPSTPARPSSPAVPAAPATNTNVVSSEPASTQEQQVASAAPQPSSTTPVDSLLQKAKGSLLNGDLEGAAAYLENAQRIAPQNAKILYDIANIRYHQGRYKDAENFAGRAVQVSSERTVLKKSWTLISNARKKLGDSQGAVLAGNKAASY